MNRKIKNILRRLIPASARSYVRLLWAKLCYSTFKSRTIRHRYGPYDLTMDVLDAKTALGFSRDVDELPDIGFLCERTLRPGQKVLNVGANQGLQAMLLAKTVGPNGFVWAVEPNIRKAQAARRNFQINGIGNCEVVNASVGSCENQSRSGNHISRPPRRAVGEAVPALTIDSLAAKFGEPDLITLDVHGCECAILESAEKTLQLRHSCWFVVVQPTFEKRGGSLEKLLSFFPGEAYQIFARDFQSEGFREIASFSEIPGQHFVFMALPRRYC